MGSNGSKFVKKVCLAPFNSSSNNGKYNEYDSIPTTNSFINKSSGNIVLARQGSMYFDEDGDLAHEFYIEELSTKKGVKSKMIRVRKKLTPQGEVKYPSPRLHSDYPLVLYQI
uniref:Tumor suppressor candidate 2 n=1 Tax=Clastoptera arizonana TaxID=38151 RepID=A0A1B6E2H7_9HEMI